MAPVARSLLPSGWRGNVLSELKHSLFLKEEYDSHCCADGHLELLPLLPVFGNLTTSWMLHSQNRIQNSLS